jgi:hypothetical protein
MFNVALSLPLSERKELSQIAYERHVNSVID